MLKPFYKDINTFVKNSAVQNILCAHMWFYYYKCIINWWTCVSVRYNPENLATLERYVETQARENAYDLEANLAVLKLWVTLLLGWQIIFKPRHNVAHRRVFTCQGKPSTGWISFPDILYQTGLFHQFIYRGYWIIFKLLHSSETQHLANVFVVFKLLLQRTRTVGRFCFKESPCVSFSAGTSLTLPTFRPLWPHRFCWRPWPTCHTLTSLSASVWLTRHTYPFGIFSVKITWL